LVHRWGFDVLRRYLLYGTKPEHGFASVIAAADVLLRDVKEKIRQGVCPYCGKKVKHMYSHLSNGIECGTQFEFNIAYALNIARHLHSFAGRSKSRKSWKYRCSICGERFEKLYDTYVHVLSEHFDTVMDVLNRKA